MKNDCTIGKITANTSQNDVVIFLDAKLTINKIIDIIVAITIFKSAVFLFSFNAHIPPNPYKYVNNKQNPNNNIIVIVAPIPLIDNNAILVIAPNPTENNAKIPNAK